MYEQVERLYLSNEYRLGILAEEFFEELGKRAPDRILNQVTPDDQYQVSDVYWSDKMVDIYGQVRALITVQDQLDTILSMNKPSLLEG